jgi:cholesterol oxidase
MPAFVRNYLEEVLSAKVKNVKLKILLEVLGEAVRMSDGLSRVMPWFSNGVDAANGRLYLKRVWYAPWRRRLRLDWEIEKSKALFDAIVSMHTHLSNATGGEAKVSPLWEHYNLLITPHPLGGCNMGTTVADGVVNHCGEVFGCPNLYVADGAIVPEAIGINPSRTIAALAERIAHLIN